MSGLADEPEVTIEEVIVLDKYFGDPEPENLIERVHVKNGQIIRREFFDNGELIETEEKEVD